MILFQTDAEKSDGKELASEHRVQGYPTFVLADAGGRTLDTWSGYAKSPFLEQFGEAISDPTTIDEKRARFAREPTSADAGKLARYHGTRGEYPEAVALYRRAGELGSARDFAFDILWNTVQGYLEAGEFGIPDIREAADALVAGPDPEPGEVVDTFFLMRQVASRAKRRELAAPYVVPALAAAEASEEAGLVKARKSLRVDHALLVLKDEGRALELKRAAMPEGWKDDASQLNGFAWWCFENSVNLEEAEALARRGVELAAPGSERAMILDTVAEICNARGNCPEAVTLMKQAVAEAPDRKHFREQLERFENLLAAMN